MKKSINTIQGRIEIIDKEYFDLINYRQMTYEEMMSYCDRYPVLSSLCGCPKIFEPKTDCFVLLRKRREELMMTMGIEEAQIISERTCRQGYKGDWYLDIVAEDRNPITA